MRLACELSEVLEEEKQRVRDEAANTVRSLQEEAKDAASKACREKDQLKHQVIDLQVQMKRLEAEAEDAVRKARQKVS